MNRINTLSRLEEKLIGESCGEGMDEQCGKCAKGLKCHMRGWHVNCGTCVKTGNMYSNQKYMCNLGSSTESYFLQSYI